MRSPRANVEFVTCTRDFTFLSDLVFKREGRKMKANSCNLFATHIAIIWNGRFQFWFWFFITFAICFDAHFEFGSIELLHSTCDSYCAFLCLGLFNFLLKCRHKRRSVSIEFRMWIRVWEKFNNFHSFHLNELLDTNCVCETYHLKYTQYAKLQKHNTEGKAFIIWIVIVIVLACQRHGTHVFSGLYLGYAH